MKYAYQSLKLSNSERLWLSEVFKGNTNPRKIRARLWGQLDKNFDPNSIDKSLLWGTTLSLIGIWYLDRESPLFEQVDKLIKTIREQMIKCPDMERISSEKLSKLAAIPQEDVEIALHYMSQLGHFFSSASLKSGKPGYCEFTFSDEDGFEDYFRYESIDQLMEERFNSKRLVPITGSSDFSVSERPLTMAEMKRGAAFIIMAIDPNEPELEDINNTIKDVCLQFGIEAYRVDEIQHQERITDVILNEIRSCQFIIADLTFERPNVYYEIGYAHAIGKRPILFRKHGVKLHFDLSVHNVPEYKNVTSLRKLLIKRFKALLESGIG